MKQSSPLAARLVGRRMRTACLGVLLSLFFAVAVCGQGSGGAMQSPASDAPPPGEHGGRWPPAAADFTPSRPGDSRELALLVDAADFIFDGVLTEASSRILDGHRVLVTDYRFAVDEWFKLDRGRELTLTALGGETSDGRGMTTEFSLRLTPGRRYLVFVRRQEQELLPFLRVFQVADGGATVADEAGRIVTGLADGLVRTRAEAELPSLAYLAVPATAARSLRPFQPPDALRGEQPPSSPDPEPPVGAEEVLDRIGAVLGQPRDPAKTGSNKSGAEDPPPPPLWLWCGRIQEAQNYFAWVPDDDNWDWWGDCSVNWNTLVDDNPSGDDWLVGFFTSGGEPIRDRDPLANDGDNHTGLPSEGQLAAGGYGITWSGLNGVNFTWYLFSTCTEIIENDTFVNPSLTNDEPQFRKSMTHEMGHALGQATNGAGGHEERFFALMYPGTFRQPPNYASVWYGRMDDMAGVRDFLVTSNDFFPGSWVFEQWTDMATWSQTHESSGSTGDLIMTTLESFIAAPGDSLDIEALHVENRGNLDATNVFIRFYLSTNNIITDLDEEVGAAFWSTFSAHGYWSNGTWTLDIPETMAPGDYFVGWILTLDQSERSEANNVAILVDDSDGGFEELQITITGSPDLIVIDPGVSKSDLTPGEIYTLSATTFNQGDGPSDASTLRYLQSDDSTIDTGDLELSTDTASALDPGESDPDSDLETAPASPGTYWVGACVDSVAGESSTGNNCSTGVEITVADETAPDLVVIDVGVSSAELSPGEAYTLSATTHNQGDAPSDASTLRYLQSDDPLIDFGDLELSTDTASALNPGESDPDSDLESAPLTPGTYWVGGCVDPVAGESNTANNCSAAIQIIVTEPACENDLVLENDTLTGTQSFEALVSITLGPNLIVDGTQIDMTAGQRIALVDGVEISGTFAAGTDAGVCQTTAARR